MKRGLIAGALMLSLADCSTVTIRPDGNGKLGTEPTREMTYNYYFWGLVGEHRVDVQAACGDRPVRQIQAQDTFENRVFTVITFGIYAPRSARVWCG